MKRRDFLGNLSSALVLPVVVDGFSAKAFTGSSPFLNALLKVAGQTDRVLVVVQLNGGNDGLNTVLPLDQYSTYMTLRGNIAIPEAKVLRLTANNTAGLHPTMTGLQRLYNDGKVSMVQGVSYPQPNFSHFRSSDIWFTAADSTQNLPTGWMGRYLDSRFPNYPDAYPNPQMPDPLAIQIGYVSSTALLGSKVSTATVIQNPDTFAQLVGDKPTVAPSNLPNTYSGKQIGFIRQQQVSSVQYAAQIKTAANKATNKATYPTNNTLADQLKIVARLIAGGLQTKIYYVTLGGFDTHAAQVQATDTTAGDHANLLRMLSDAIASFQNDVEQLGIADHVVGMTFSEFGRRAASNNSLGTDHGTSAPLFVFGKGVKGGMIGKSANLTDLDNGNFKMQYDFRQIYASVLNDWFGTEKNVSDLVLQRTFATLPIFGSGTVLGFNDHLFEEKILSFYPNPAVSDIVIELEDLFVAGARLRVIDMAGREVMQQNISAVQQMSLNISNFAIGQYVLRVESGKKAYSGKLMVVR
jgi:uncharacterized protein (DUF1501 family)